jgi:hypothetical protein
MNLQSQLSHDASRAEVFYLYGFRFTTVILISDGYCLE